MDGKKSKGLIETQPMELAHKLLHLSLSNGIATQIFCFIRFRFLFMGPRANLTIRIYQPKNIEYISLTLKAQQILRINEVMRFVRTGHVSTLQTSTF